MRTINISSEAGDDSFGKVKYTARVVVEASSEGHPGYPGGDEQEAMMIAVRSLRQTADEMEQRAKELEATSVANRAARHAAWEAERAAELAATETAD